MVDLLRDQYSFPILSGENILSNNSGLVIPLSACGKVVEKSILDQACKMNPAIRRVVSSLLASKSVTPGDGTLRVIGDRTYGFVLTRGPQGVLLPLSQIIQGMHSIAGKFPQVAKARQMAVPMLACGGDPSYNWHEIKHAIFEIVDSRPCFSSVYQVSCCHPLHRGGC